jgi:hypothetical protein
MIVRVSVGSLPWMVEANVDNERLGSVSPKEEEQIRQR